MASRPLEKKNVDSNSKLLQETSDSLVIQMYTSQPTLQLYDCTLYCTSHVACSIIKLCSSAILAKCTTWSRHYAYTHQRYSEYGTKLSSKWETTNLYTKECSWCDNYEWKYWEHFESEVMTDTDVVEHSSDVTAKGRFDDIGVMKH